MIDACELIDIWRELHPTNYNSRGILTPNLQYTQDKIPSCYLTELKIW